MGDLHSARDSSVPSLQSFVPSHRRSLAIQSPSGHRNLSSEQLLTIVIDFVTKFYSHVTESLIWVY